LLLASADYCWVGVLDVDDSNEGSWDIPFRMDRKTAYYVLLIRFLRLDEI
jgi:hypothetical protein